MTDLSSPSNKKVGQRLQDFEDILSNRSDFFAGYPDNLEYDYEALKRFFDYSMINAGDPFVDTDWDLHSKNFEREAVEWFASLYQLESCWGYVTSGGTEGNLYGIFLGRETCPDGVLYFSEETHYSIAKAAYMMKIPYVIVPCSDNGEIDYQFLEGSLNENSDKPAIMNLNMGTTMKGAIDDIDRVSALLKAHSAGFYLHCDAALSGMLLPFIPDAPSINFQEYPINSLAVSGNKFIGSPIPNGVVLARPDIVDKVGIQVDYIGCKDSTILGVRSGLAALCLWYAIQTREHQFPTEAKQCIDNAKYLQQSLEESGIPAQLNNYSNTVVFTKPPQAVCRRWQLATNAGMAHIVVMQHLTPNKIDRIVSDMISTQQQQD